MKVEIQLCCCFCCVATKEPGIFPNILHLLPQNLDEETKNIKRVYVTYLNYRDLDLILIF